MASRILVLVGTRPEAIKLCPVVHELRATDGVDTTVVATGQHRELLDQAFADFDITPDLNISVMEQDQSLASLTGKLLAGIDDVLRDLRPHWTIVQGDTTTALSGALASFYRRVPVAHVEAGLRTYDRTAPFPEEANRQCISRIADRHFANTDRAVSNLVTEGIDDRSIVLSGSTSIDALAWMRTRVRSGEKDLGSLPSVPPNAPLMLLTCHRRESFGDRMLDVWAAVRSLLDLVEDLQVVFPVHPNPNVRRAVFDLLGDHPRVHLIEPVPYPQMVALIDMASIILSDSGGLQEEVPGLGKPLLVLRDTTERPEAVESGGAVLVGTDRERIVTTCFRLLTDADSAAEFRTVVNPFGDGHASAKIVRSLLASDLEGPPAAGGSVEEYAPGGRSSETVGNQADQSEMGRA